MRDPLTYPNERELRRLLSTPITRRSLLAGGASLAALAAAACASGGTSTTPKQASKDTLIFTRPSNYEPVFNAGLAVFKQQYGRTAVLNSVAGDYNTIVETQLLGGAQFDVLEADAGLMGPWLKQNLIQPVEGLPKLDEIKANIFPAAIADMTTPDGRFVGLPYYTQVSAFFINAEIFDKANLAAPQTWEEVIDTARTLKSRGLASAPLAPVWRKNFVAGAYSLMSQAFSQGMQAAFDSKFNPVYEHDPAMLQALKNMKALYTEKLVPQDCLTYSGPDAVSNFTSGKSAMFTHYSYYGATINRPPSPITGKVKMIPYPGKLHRSWSVTAAHLMSAHETDRAGAWELLTFLSATDKNGAYTMPVQYVTQIGVPVPYTSVNADPAVQASLAKWVDVPIYVDQLSKGVSVGSAINTPWFAQWEDILITQMQNVLTSGTDPQAALTTSADFVRNSLKAK